MIRWLKKAAQTYTHSKILILLMFGFILVCALSVDPFYSSAAMRVITASIMAVGLDICTGLAGQLSMGQAAFMGIGAYAASVITSKVPCNWFFYFCGLLAAVLACAFFALIVGTPVLSLSGDYLALATLGFGEIVRIVLENLKYTGGAAGLYHIPLYSTPALCYSFFVAAILLARHLKYSKLGLFCTAVSDDEKAASACGVPAKKIKVTAFTLSAILCGGAGFLYAGYMGFIGPGDFAFAKSIDVLAAVILGGPGTILGPALAAAALEMLTISLQQLSKFRMLIFAVVLIIVTIIRYKKGGKKRG